MISSSIYPLEVVQAERFLEDLAKNKDLKPNDKWDGSIIALLNYPEIVKMMSDDLDWTQVLGEAAINQQKDLLVAIQQLRDQAVASGVLATTEQVQVVQENNNVIIRSADPEVVYVPTYPPQMLYDPTYVYPPNPIVYANPYPSYYYPGAAFFTGFVTGAVWGSVVDWNNWGTWGGNTNVKIKVNGDRVNVDYGDINIGNNNNIGNNVGNKVDFSKIDKSKIDVTNAKFDKTSIKNNLEGNELNRVSNKVKDSPGQIGKAPRTLESKDVRKNVQEGLKNPQGKPGIAQGGGAGKPAIGQGGAGGAGKPALGGGGGGGGGKPAIKPVQPIAKPANRPAASSPKAPDYANKSVGKAKPAARVDSRPKNPSVLGDPGGGRQTQMQSSRGNASRGGGGGGRRGGGGGGGKMKGKRR